MPGHSEMAPPVYSHLAFSHVPFCLLMALCCLHYDGPFFRFHFFRSNHFNASLSWTIYHLHLFEQKNKINDTKKEENVANQQKDCLGSLRIVVVPFKTVCACPTECFFQSKTDWAAFPAKSNPATKFVGFTYRGTLRIFNE